MYQINKKYLHRSCPTNVIAFPLRTDPFSNINPERLGDVVISIETAEKEGKSIGISMEERFTQLLVHGILHLLGYDHGKRDDLLVMQQKQRKILRLLGYDLTDLEDRMENEAQPPRTRGAHSKEVPAKGLERQVIKA